MKRLHLLLAALLLSAAAFAQNGRQIYNRYSGTDGIEAVYISPAMFRLIGKIPDIELQDGGVNFSSLIRSMSGFYLLSTSDAKTGVQLAADVRKYIDSGRYELLMEAKDSGQTVQLFTVGDEQTVTSFVLFSQDAGEVSFICLEGRMDRREMEKLLASAAAS